MKKKTINAVICKKFNELLESVKDGSVRKLIEQNTIITGGCIASMLQNEPVNDYDLYFTNKATAKAVAEYYIKQFNEANGTDGFVVDGADKKKLEEYIEGGFVAGANLTEDRIKICFPSNGVAKENRDPA